ncbi:alpha/beta hydrolase [Sphingobium sp. AS12]|uniref:alpha/beta hydrolase n=1 Tax=Sphingobium sp. AS12 TaxID=2849495 RepID=UPI001C319E3B|nr:alpha/beta hydrolase [Sphingobium sp. AS12]MBV2149113.1 alpha/beta hydrolase [Sphingobium sp. AS12]
MLMDADAQQLMEALKTLAPLPTPDAVAADYRAEQMAKLAMREKDFVAVDRVETFEIVGQDGPVTVRLYIDGADAALRPVLIYMHGGGFVICNIDTHDAFCRRLAQETGCAVLSVDYRLAPEHPYPAGFNDACDALIWAASDAAAAEGIDPTRIAVGGDSAGGAFAAALAQWARDTGGPKIAHQLMIYPVINNDFTTASYKQNANDYYLTTEAMRWFWRQYLGDENAFSDSYAAPGRASDLSGLPPATIVTASFDPLRDEGIDYARRLEAAGVPVEYRDYAAFHGFAGMEMLKSAQDSRAFIVARLKAAL